MSILDFNRPVYNNHEIATGKLLIADPFLADANFSRSVVLLCEHGEEGTVGFVLNNNTDIIIGDLLPEISAATLVVGQGGPVQTDTLHMIHRIHDVLGGNKVVDGVYWGGSYETLQAILAGNSYDNDKLQLFVGYSGWSPGQLQEEIEQRSWIVTDFAPHILFETDTDDMWKAAIISLGKDYEYLINLPINPQLN
ncbi:MAG: YqgE/AlgH family protein [Sphingobacteriales bacterium]|nr:MAG: YqgE/AlgH family protein [Sphingobacteriales bacterium]